MLVEPPGNRFLIGPFAQALTMDGLAPEGPLQDNHLHIITDAGIIIDSGKILEIGKFDDLRKIGDPQYEIESPAVVLPGFIDAHTHLCFAGSRSHDYEMRLSGKTYQQIAEQGGGILDTVRKTREASRDVLIELMLKRLQRHLASGVTTCEVKSGYGLNVWDEIKMLEAIQEAANRQPVDLVPTCMAAHALPWEFTSKSDYLEFLQYSLLPMVLERNLSKRADIFVEKEAFPAEEARPYLLAAKALGFSIVVHADQFTRGGAMLAAELHADSADHLEVSNAEDLKAMKKSGVVPVVLPGASLGLGIAFPPARMILDAGLPLVIGSDWNPGSAPMGQLLLQAAVLGAAQRLTMAETLAALTVRAAGVLKLSDRGRLVPGFQADIIIFSCPNYQEILYNQGSVLPSLIVCHKRLR